MHLSKRLYVNMYWVTGVMFGIEFDHLFHECTINLGIFKLFVNWGPTNAAYPERDFMNDYTT